MADVTVAVDTTISNATLSSSVMKPMSWGSNTRFLALRDNDRGATAVGTGRHAGSRPVYEGDGTSDNFGPTVRQGMDRIAEIGGGYVFNAFSYNSATGNPWPDPTHDCPASDTGTYPYFGYHPWNGGISPGPGAIAFLDRDGWFLLPAGVDGSDTGIPWATDDVKVMQARCLYHKEDIVAAMRAAPGWMTSGWNASTTSGDYSTSPHNHQINNSAEPQRVNGGPPLFMNVVASGSASSTIGFAGTCHATFAIGATSGTITAAGTGQWGTSGAVINLANGDVVTFEPGTANEETVTLTTVTAGTGACTFPALAKAHAAGKLVVKLGGTRIIPSFWGGNAQTAGQAATGYADPNAVAAGRPWTFQDCFARLCRRFAERYPFIQIYWPWGEPGNSNKMSVDGNGVASTNDTGEWLQTDRTFWADNGSSHTMQASPSYTPGGRNNMPFATVLYNKVDVALRGIPGRNYVTTPLKFGGPYHACVKLTTTANTLESADQGALTVFFNNANTPDFIVFDGFGYASGSLSVANTSDPYAVLAALDDAGKGLLAAINALRAFTAAWGYDGLEFHQGESYYDSATSTLGSGGGWFTSDIQGMTLATILYYSLLAGVARHARWQPQGDTASSFNGWADPTKGNTFNLESVISPVKNSDTATSGLTAAVLGQPFPAHGAYKGIYDNFPPGMNLVQATVTDGAATAGKTIRALANDAGTVYLINQYPTTKTVDLSVNSPTATTITLPGYSIRVITTPDTAGAVRATPVKGTIVSGAALPRAGVTITAQMLVPDGAIALDAAGDLIDTTPLTTITDTTGTFLFDPAATPSNGLIAPQDWYQRVSGSLVPLVGGRWRFTFLSTTIDSDSFAYSATALDISLWTPTVSTLGLFKMFLGTVFGNAQPVQGRQFTIAVASEAVWTGGAGAGQVLDAGSSFPVTTNSDGKVFAYLVRQSELTPSAGAYTAANSVTGTRRSFQVPTAYTNDAGVWDSVTTFALNAVVRDPATDEPYISLASGNLNHALTDTTKWAVYDGENVTAYTTLVVPIGSLAITTANLPHDSNVPARAGAPYPTPTSLSQDLANLNAYANQAFVFHTLGSDVTMTSANTAYDGPTTGTLAVGTWLITAGVTVLTPASIQDVTVKLWDGTTVKASATANVPASKSVSLPLGCVVVLTSTATFKVTAFCSGAGAAIKAAAPVNGAGNNASWILATRIA